MTTPSPSRADGLAETRSAPELLALLLDLGRALKARRCCRAGDPRPTAFLERAFRACQIDLARHGPLDLELGERCFRTAGGLEIRAPRALREAWAGLLAPEVRHLRLEADLDREAFAAFVERLTGAPAGPLAQERRTPAEARPEPGPAASPASETGNGAPAGSARSGQAQAGPTSARDARAGAGRPAGVPQGAQIQEDGELAELLEDLETCEDALRYAELARRAVQRSGGSDGGGRTEQALDMMALLARHAAEGQKRSPALAAAARDALGTLAALPVLDEVIELAGEADAEAGLRASQILVELGPQAAGPLLRAATHATDDDRRGRLDGTLLALGEEAVPELVRAMRSSDRNLVRHAIRLAGEVSSPLAVAQLETLLGDAEAECREEAARALARIGDSNATRALSRALRSPLPRMPEIAARCLGATAQPDVVTALSEALQDAVRGGRTEFARELIRALARLGLPEAGRPLTELLLRRPLRRRRRVQELQIAAAAALAQVPGEEAVGALTQVAGRGSPALREAAARALERRAAHRSRRPA